METLARRLADALTRYHKEEHPLSHFTEAWVEGLTSEYGANGPNVLEVEARHYRRALAAMRRSSYDVGPKVRAIADLADPTETEDFWLSDPPDVVAAERIFLVEMEQFFDDTYMWQLIGLLEKHARQESCTVRFGRAGAFGELPSKDFPDAVGRHLLLIDPDLVGGYVKREKGIFLKLIANQYLFEEQVQRYSQVENATVEFESGWDIEQARRAWVENEQAGDWKAVWNKRKSGRGYYDKYEIHIRCWIPFYRRFVSHCAEVVQRELTKRIQARGGSLRVMELGFGTGNLTAELVAWLAAVNRPFARMPCVEPYKPVDSYVGLDSAPEMLEAVQQRAECHLEGVTHFRCCTFGEKLPEDMEHERYDLICSMLMFHDLVQEDSAAHLKELIADLGGRLSDGGCLVIGDCFTNWEPDKREEYLGYWQECMKTHGLQPAQIDGFIDENQDMVLTVEEESVRAIAQELGLRAPRMSGIPHHPKSPFKVLVLEKSEVTEIAERGSAPRTSRAAA